MFFHFHYGDDKKVLVNTHCTVKHLFYYIRTKAGLAETDRIELCSSDGMLTNTCGTLGRYFSDISPHTARKTLVAIKIEETAEHIKYTPMLENAFSIYPDLRERLGQNAPAAMTASSTNLITVTSLSPASEHTSPQHKSSRLAQKHSLGDQAGDVTLISCVAAAQQPKINFKAAVSLTKQGKAPKRKNSVAVLQVKSPAIDLLKPSSRRSSVAKEQNNSLVTYTQKFVQITKATSSNKRRKSYNCIYLGYPVGMSHMDMRYAWL